MDSKLISRVLYCCFEVGSYYVDFEVQTWLAWNSLVDNLVWKFLRDLPASVSLMLGLKVCAVKLSGLSFCFLRLNCVSVYLSGITNSQYRR